MLVFVYLHTATFSCTSFVIFTHCNIFSFLVCSGLFIHCSIFLIIADFSWFHSGLLLNCYIYCSGLVIHYYCPKFIVLIHCCCPATAISLVSSYTSTVRPQLLFWSHRTLVLFARRHCLCSGLIKHATILADIHLLTLGSCVLFCSRHCPLTLFTYANEGGGLQNQTTWAHLHPWNRLFFSILQIKVCKPQSCGSSLVGSSGEKRSVCN